jgi:hypothetical protein
VESEPDEIDSEIDSEHESRPRDWRFWVRAVALTLLVGAFVASFLLEGDAARNAFVVAFSIGIVFQLVSAACSWRSATWEERCRRLGHAAFLGAFIVYYVVESRAAGMVLVSAITIWLVVLCVDTYRSLDAARPNYGSPPLRARRAGGRTNFPDAPAAGAARRSP